MSVIQHKQPMTLRRWQIVALLVLALLAIVAISYVMLSTGGHIDHLHLFTYLDPTPDIMNGRP